jgi:hypothetical protein
MSTPLNLVVPAAANAPGPAVNSAAGTGSGSVTRIDAGDVQTTQPPFAQVLQKLVKTLGPQNQGAPATAKGIATPDLTALQIAANAAAVAGNTSTADPGITEWRKRSGRPSRAIGIAYAATSASGAAWGAKSSRDEQKGWHRQGAR